MKLDNALNFIEHLGDSFDSVRRLLEEGNKKGPRNVRNVLKPLKLVAGTGFEPATSGL